MMFDNNLYNFSSFAAVLQTLFVVFEEFLVVLFCNLCGMLSTLLIGGSYFESSRDIYLQLS